MHKALKVVLWIASRTISALTMVWQMESGVEFSTVAQTLQTLEFRLRDMHVCDLVYVYVHAYNPACDQDENLESKTGPCRYWKAGAGLTTP